MNETLEKLYNDFIEAYDPYYQEEAPETLEGMLYNLEEINKELDDNETELIELITNTIGQFKAAGIERWEA
jgi:hypothetical protein